MELKLAAHPSSIRRGRHWVVERALEEGAHEDTARIVELLTSELVTNAVKYGPPDGVITVRTDRADGVFDVAVCDQGSQTPTPKDPAPGEPGGRGLRLVASLSTDWGVRRKPGRGKSIWFRLPLNP